MFKFKVWEDCIHEKEAFSFVLALSLIIGLVAIGMSSAFAADPEPSIDWSKTNSYGQMESSNMDASIVEQFGQLHVLAATKSSSGWADWTEAMIGTWKAAGAGGFDPEKISAGTGFEFWVYITEDSSANAYFSIKSVKEGEPTFSTKVQNLEKGSLQKVSILYSDLKAESAGDGVAKGDAADAEVINRDTLQFCGKLDGTNNPKVTFYMSDVYNIGELPEIPDSEDPTGGTEDPTGGTEVKYGDVTGEGAINSADALEVLKHAVELITLKGDQLTAADVTDDGNVDSADALDILKYNVELIDHFDVEDK